MGPNLASFSPEIPTQDFPSKNDLGQLWSRLRSNPTRWFFIKLEICHFRPILYLFDPKTLEQDFFFQRNEPGDFSSLDDILTSRKKVENSYLWLRMKTPDKRTNWQTNKRTNVQGYFMGPSFCESKKLFSLN